MKLLRPYSQGGHHLSLNIISPGLRSGVAEPVVHEAGFQSSNGALLNSTSLLQAESSRDKFCKGAERENSQVGLDLSSVMRERKGGNFSN